MKPIRFISLLLAALLAVLSSGCGLFESVEEASEPFSAPEPVSAETEPEPDPEYPVEAGGVNLLARPGAVVSLAPSLTEKLYDLGFESRLVGISDYCDYPDAIMELPLCGTAQLPDVDAILGRDARLVLSESELPESVMDELSARDVSVAVLPHANSVGELLDVYVELAVLLEGDVSGRAMGESFAEDYADRLADIESVADGQPEELRNRKALYLRLMDFTVATGDTFENELLERIGLDNIAKDYDGWAYPEDVATSADGVAAFASVDMIFMDEQFVTITDLEQSAFYKGLPATIHDRYLYIECIEMERQSLRTLDLLADMAEYAYPKGEEEGTEELPVE